MRLARDLLHQIAVQNLSESERAALRCRLAAQLQEAGNYDAASEALGELWQGVSERPKLDGLTEATSATVLLRAGSLTRDIGSASQIKGSLEIAKDLLTESISAFQALGITDGVAEAQIEMAVCYRREGGFEEARAMLKTALESLSENRTDLIALGVLRSATVEGSAQRFHDALRIYTEAAPLIEKNDDAILSGKFHHCYGTLLKKLGVAEQCQEYIDRALIEFAAASFYFEETELTRHQASVENNLGFLYLTIGKLVEAHEHLDRAQALFTSLRDRVHLAQVDETRARILLAGGKIVEAERLASTAVHTLEIGGEQSLLAEALSTQGIGLARMRDLDKARATLQRAVEVSEQAGDTESAGQATLLMIEQLGTHLSNNDLKVTVGHALHLLKDTQDMSTLRRLVNGVWQVLSLIHASPGFPSSVDWTKFSVTDEVLRYEAHFVRLALRDSGGRVTRAAHLLGLQNHQTLLSWLDTRHKDLIDERTPIRLRRSLIRDSDAKRRSRKKPSKRGRRLKILYAEDNDAVTEMVKKRLAEENWEFEVCTEGEAAMKKIASNAHYALLLLDYEMPGVNGVQLVQQARSLAHRHQTPIIILSATLDENTAKLAGADAFLRKPEDIMELRKTISRLLDQARN